MHRIATILAAAGALLVPVSMAGADTLPKAAPKCTYKVPKSYPLSSLTKNGLPVRVTCDADATVSSLVDMTGKLDRDWDGAHHHNTPGIALPEDTKVKARVSAVTHVRVTRSAARFLKRYHRPRLRVLLGVLMPDGDYQSVDGGKHVVLR